FQWTPYEDPAIQAVIPDEFLQNPNAWHAKVALISYATDPWQAVFTVSRRETAVITCPKGKTLAFKSKTKGR
ncbi:hypothetical protein Goshw_013284, partial [Gossypium schwendimanii]|nr:hypothetical protein [Gossypium schwendimanii]